MTDSSSSGKEPTGTAGQLTKLRKLILGPTNQRLDGLEEQLEDPEHQARKVSRVLPMALTRSAAKDNRLAAALGPITENAIRTSILKDRRILVDALSPVMGPAIRKAIASTIQGLIENFNQVLDQSLSIRGLRWRMEALRTRRPFAEIVLLNTLIYQVEQVFLIRRDSGLLLEHVVAKTAVARDPDLVSAMLTAIQDFVHDSFGAGREETVDNFQVGEHKIWIEHGTFAMLAIVIRGIPPVDLKEMMRDALDEIHLQHADALSKMDGDCEALEACRPTLNGLLQVRFKKARRRTSYRQWVLLTVVLGLIGWGIFMHIANARRLARFVDQLHSQPGVVVTQVKKQGGRLHIYGMKDPLAPEPSAIMEPADIAAGEVAFTWEPYQSAHPPFAVRRIATLFKPPSTVDVTFVQGTVRTSGSALHQWITDSRRLAQLAPWIEHYDDQRVVDIDARLAPPPSVTFELKGKTLCANGSAPRAWIQRTREAVVDLPAITAYDDATLRDADADAWDAASQSIDESIFYFQAGRSALMKGQEKDLTAFLGAAKRLMASAQLLDRPFRIDVFGHADQTGEEAFNIAISHERAQVLTELLIGSGIEPSSVVLHAVGSREPANPPLDEASRARNRRVTFKVRPETAPGALHIP